MKVPRLPRSNLLTSPARQAGEIEQIEPTTRTRAMVFLVVALIFAGTISCTIPVSVVVADGAVPLTPVKEIRTAAQDNGISVRFSELSDQDVSIIDRLRRDPEIVVWLGTREQSPPAAVAVRLDRSTGVREAGRYVAEALRSDEYQRAPVLVVEANERGSEIAQIFLGEFEEYRGVEQPEVVREAVQASPADIARRIQTESGDLTVVLLGGRSVEVMEEYRRTNGENQSAFVVELPSESIGWELLKATGNMNENERFPTLVAAVVPDYDSFFKELRSNPDVVSPAQIPTKLTRY